MARTKKNCPVRPEDANNDLFKKIKAAMPKPLRKFSIENSVEGTFFVHCSVDYRMKNDGADFRNAVEAWLKPFGFEEYGGGTDGNEYDIHCGPNKKLLTQRKKNAVKFVKSKLAEMSNYEFGLLVGVIQNIAPGENIDPKLWSLDLNDYKTSK